MVLTIFICYLHEKIWLNWSYIFTELTNKRKDTPPFLNYMRKIILNIRPLLNFKNLK